MGLKSFRSALLLGAAALGMSAASAALTSAYAQEATRTYAIEPQELDDALREFGRQTGRDILFAPDAAAGKRSPGVEGQMTERQALEALLAGTGLRFEQTASNGYAVQDPNSPIRLGDASGAAPSETEEELVVTGTRIRGAAPVGAPLSVYEREDIYRTGAGSTEQFVRTIPQNFTSVDQSTQVNATTGVPFTLSNPSFGSAVNLRNQGASSTLVLLNGHRLAPSLSGTGSFVDVSMIPFSALERVEVLTDGASAIYGADAVAGVVNFILRRDFEGGETSVRFGGSTRGGAGELRASQALGRAWAGGSALAVVEHGEQDPVRADQRDFIPPLTSLGGRPTFILPEQEADSVLLTAHQELGSVILSGDAFWTKRSYEQTSTTPISAFQSFGGTATSGISLSALKHLGETWTAEISGHYSSNDQTNHQRTVAGFGGPDSQTAYLSELAAIDVFVGGESLRLPAGALKIVLGGSYREEQLERSEGLINGTLLRDVQSAFGEIVVPILSPDQHVPLVHRLELSAAARVDDYSDFGASDLRPKVGFSWELNDQLRLRGTYGSSYRAPLLSQLDETPAGVPYIALNLPNSASPTGITPTILKAFAGNASLGPETSDSVTYGLDWYPIRGARLSLTAFDIQYEDRIATPPLVGSVFLLHSQAAALAPFIDYTPDPAEVAAIFAAGVINPFGISPANIGAIYDSAFQNIASTHTTGIEFSGQINLAAFGGQVSLFAAGDYISELDFRSASTTPPVSLVDVLFQPSDLRFRAGATWTRDGFSSSVSVSYVDDYSNPYIAEAEVNEWVTADLVLSYTSENDAGPLRGFRATLSALNVFDEDPPAVGLPAGVVPFEFNFDPRNASPLGRTVSLTLAKRW